MPFRRLKNVGFANLEDILHSCLKNTSSSKDIFWKNVSKASCKTDFKTFWEKWFKSNCKIS